MDSSVCIWAWLGWLLVRISKVPLMWLLVHRNEQQFKRCIDLVLGSPLEDKTLILFNLTFFPFQPMEIYVDDEAKLTLHGLVQGCIIFRLEGLGDLVPKDLPLRSSHQLQTPMFLIRFPLLSTMCIFC
ncbi:hypothetical protein GW17_00032215 [Ensete ventricosum]|nr:hypothetical protein GW17_00032215 [Ensete ventricosum]